MSASESNNSRELVYFALGISVDWKPWLRDEWKPWPMLMANWGGHGFCISGNQPPPLTIQQYTI